MNLKDFYTQTQAMEVLQMNHKMEIHRWRQKKHKCLGRKPFVKDICNKPFYLRQHVDDYMLSLCRNGKKQRLNFEQTKRKQRRFNLDLDIWIPRCEALKMSNYSYETLHRLATYLSNPVHFIRVKKIPIKNTLFYFYNKEDITHFLVNGETAYDQENETWQPIGKGNVFDDPNFERFLQ